VSITIDIEIDAGDWASIADPDALAERAAASVAALTGAVGEAAILLSDDARLHALNAQFRGKDKPTDVLSFPADPMDAPHLGDIAISDGVSRRDAATQGKAFADHITHLIIHGLLHLLGHDHMEDTEAAEMMGLEREALASLGIHDRYF